MLPRMLLRRLLIRQVDELGKIMRAKLGICLGMGDRRQTVLNASKIRALRLSLDKHHDNVAKILVSSKDSVETKTTIESAFRACKGAFVEVSAILLNVIEEGTMQMDTSESIKRIMSDTLNDFKHDIMSSVEKSNRAACSGACKGSSYAEVVRRSEPSARMKDGMSLEEPTTNFFITPSEEVRDGVGFSQTTKDTVCKILKPADCTLKVKRISLAPKNGIKIEAISPDLEKIKKWPALEKAGLRVSEQIKYNPTLIVYGIPKDMSATDIKK